MTDENAAWLTGHAPNGNLRLKLRYGILGKGFQRSVGQDLAAFGLGSKESWVALIGLLGVAGTGVHLGWIAMMASATGLFWAALPIACTAILLFAWGFFETQAGLHAEAAAKIAELEAAIADSKEPAPNYQAYRHVERMTLHDAAFLWSDVRIRMSMPGKVKEHFDMLRGAVQSGKLKFVPDVGAPYMREVLVQMQRGNPHINTVVTRAALKEFAANFYYDPIFLRDI